MFSETSSAVRLLCVLTGLALTAAPAGARCSGCNCDSGCMKDAWNDCQDLCNNFPMPWSCKAGCTLGYIADSACCSFSGVAPAFDIATGHAGTGIIVLGESPTIRLRAGVADAAGRFVVDGSIAFGEARIVPAATPIPVGGGFDGLPWQTVGTGIYSSIQGVIDIDIPGSLMPDLEGYRVRIDLRDGAGGIVGTALTFAGYRCQGDADGDGDADFDDLNTVLAHWGEPVAYPGEGGDVTRDGVVDFDDLNRVLEAWGGC